MPSISKRMKSIDSVSSLNQAMSEGKILGTIVLPKNLNVLSSRLPKPNYHPTPQLNK